MKNKNIKYSIIAVSILVIVLSLLYIFPNKSALNNQDSFWKSGENPIVGDAFHLSKKDKNFRNDTIFAGKLPVAVVLNVENRFWSGDRILTLKSIKTGQIADYYEK